MGTVTQSNERKVSWARNRQDNLNVYAGQMYRHCASLQKILALATHQDASWVSRQCAGDPTGATQRFYQLLAKLSQNRKADPSHLIVGGLITIRQALGDLPYAELDSRLLGEVMEWETVADTDEDRAEASLLAAWGTDGWDAALDRWHDALVESIARQLSAVLLIEARSGA